MGIDMNLKKGLTYVAFGFLMTFVSLNVKLKTVSIDILPDFAGWILIFLAYDQLGDYMKEKKYLKWIPLGMAVISFVWWILAILNITFDPDYISTIINMATILYFYFLLEVIGKIAADYGSLRVSSIASIRVAMLAGVIISLLALVSGFFLDSRYTMFLVIAVMILQVYVTIAAAFDLFLIRKEVTDQLEEKNTESDS